ncbi:MAG: glutathione S-transferase family protein [Pseudomonadota bacterium]
MELIGFPDSVFTRAARMGLYVQGREHAFTAIDPFTEEGRRSLSVHTPFGRVPVYIDGAFICYESPAILRAIDDDTLFPQGQRGARVLQVTSIVQSDVYRPLVRQVFAHGFYRPQHGASADRSEVRAGLKAASLALGALEGIAAEGLVLNTERMTAADCLLAPMIAAFAEVPEGEEELRGYPKLSDWYAWISLQAPFARTTPPWAGDT